MMCEEPPDILLLQGLAQNSMIPWLIHAFTYWALALSQTFAKHLINLISLAPILGGGCRSYLRCTDETRPWEAK